MARPTRAQTKVLRKLAGGPCAVFSLHYVAFEACLRRGWVTPPHQRERWVIGGQTILTPAGRTVLNEMGG